MPIKALVDHKKRLISTEEGGHWRNLVVRWWAWRKAKSVFRMLGKYVDGRKVLDVGLGFGVVAELFKKHGYQVIGLDVINMSMYQDIQPVIYDGLKMPFKNKMFETALLFHVLHHCNNPEAVLNETVRCAKRVIVIEDTYRSQLGYWRTEFNDCIGNMEFRKHKFRPFENWKKIIAKKGWKLVASREWWGLSQLLMPTRYCYLVIEGK